LSESEGIRLHVEGCEACAKRLQQEGTFREALGGLDYEQAPPGLETRIRAAIDADDEHAADRTWGWLDVILSRSVLGTACAALLVAVIAMATPYFISSPDEGDFAGGAPPIAGISDLVQVKGVVVCADCDAHGGSLEEQRRCRTPGLRADNGEVYHFLKTGEEDGELRNLLYSPDRRGARVAVDGRLFRDIGYIQVAQVSSL
jgi:hypothetical protein